MDTITKAKWKKLHKDYKGMIDGKPHMLKNVDGATRLVPVKIVNEDTSNIKSTLDNAEQMLSKMSVKKKSTKLFDLIDQIDNTGINSGKAEQLSSSQRGRFLKLRADYVNQSADELVSNAKKKLKILRNTLKEDVSYSSSRDIGDIRFKVIDKADSLSYVLLPKTSNEFDKVKLMQDKYNFSDGDIQKMLASYLSKPGMDLEIDTSYRGAGFGLKLVKPKLG